MTDHRPLATAQARIVQLEAALRRLPVDCICSQATVSDDDIAVCHDNGCPVEIKRKALEGGEHE